MKITVHRTARGYQDKVNEILKAKQALARDPKRSLGLQIRLRHLQDRFVTSVLTDIKEGKTAEPDQLAWMALIALREWDVKS